MLINSSSRVAVLDLTHGGIVLSKKLKNIAGRVTGIDVYDTASAKVLAELQNDGIAASREALCATDFDMLVAPEHLDPNYPMLVEARKYNIPVISHHAATGQILAGYDLKDKTIIEITGTRAKTSSSILLAKILSREKKVVSHTSRGVEDWSAGKIIKKGLSITPASMLSALDAIYENGIEPQVLIFEISLGGTGSADIGVITTIYGDYGIANSSRMASDAKRQMILNAKRKSTLVINNDALRAFGACRRDVSIISFSDTVNASCNVYFEEINSKGGTIAYFLRGRKGRITVNESPDYDISSYKTAFVCATAVALSMGIDEGTIGQAIREFKGAEGRMKKTTFSGRTLIDNSNSGMNIITAEKALEFSREKGGKIVMVLGEEAKEVCEGLDPAAVSRFIDRHLDELDSLILVGERMRPLVRENLPKIHHADNLSEGMGIAKSLTQEKDIILSCVKCFR